MRTVGIKGSADIESGLKFLGLLFLFVLYPVVTGFASWGHWGAMALLESIPVGLAVLWLIPIKWLERLIEGRR